MRQMSLLCGGLAALASLLLALPAAAESADARAKDEQAIHATAKAYQEALAKGDAKGWPSFGRPTAIILIRLARPIRPAS